MDIARLTDAVSKIAVSLRKNLTAKTGVKLIDAPPRIVAELLGGRPMYFDLSLREAKG